MFEVDKKGSGGNGASRLEAGFAKDSVLCRLEIFK
jgi:hypothetical protein